MPTLNLKNITIKEKQEIISAECGRKRQTIPEPIKNYMEANRRMLYNRHEENDFNERYCQNEIPFCSESSCMSYYPKENILGTTTKQFADHSIFLQGLFRLMKKEKIRMIGSNWKGEKWKLTVFYGQ